ncbi:3127_t:CDS:2 [Ambispora leptoticha]|uniref:3127_t:CDS:1 n=1 Tax=Ambispora leptoticha TaxID=144679 RepID=A0A9N8YQY0_9GLOM|nr:3127_t:CDS:2 [Ambispora leptoticha]
MASFIFRMLGFSLLCLTTVILQVNAQVQCSASSPCPASAPCCSEFGYCGTGRFCLGGCNPLLSFNSTSCAPNPICKSMTYNLNDTSKFINSASYNGELTYDFTTDGQPIFSNNVVILTMAQGSKGTRISTTRYVYYGRITAVLKTSRTQGIVTAFITMSNVKDEIDWEWVGYNLNMGQSNYFYRGVIDYQNAATHPTNASTFDNFHEYTIDWQETQLQWFIDGQLVRTLYKKDTLNATTGVYMYPSTPSRIQLSIWNGGEGAAGTKEWAGGQTNWNSPDIKSPGYFYAQIRSLDIKCYGQEASNSSSQQLTSYVYGDNGNISVSNANTVIKVATSQSLGLPQDAGNDVNNMPNITGQYIEDLKASSADINTIALTPKNLALTLLSLFFSNLLNLL